MRNRRIETGYEVPTSSPLFGLPCPKIINGDPVIIDVRLIELDPVEVLRRAASEGMPVSRDHNGMLLFPLHWLLDFELPSEFSKSVKNNLWYLVQEAPRYLKPITVELYDDEAASIIGEIDKAGL